MLKKLTILIALAIILEGCSQSAATTLVGDWSPNAECDGFFGEGLIFNDDGTMQTKDGERYTKWSLSEDETMITFTNPDFAIYDEFEFTYFDDETISIINPASEWQDKNVCQITKN